MSESGVFPGLYCPVFAPNIEIYRVHIRILPQSKKIRNRKKSKSGHFLRTGTHLIFLNFNRYLFNSVEENDLRIQYRGTVPSFFRWVYTSDIAYNSRIHLLKYYCSG